MSATDEYLWKESHCTDCRPRRKRAQGLIMSGQSALVKPLKVRKRSGRVRGRRTQEARPQGPERPKEATEEVTWHTYGSEKLQRWCRLACNAAGIQFAAIRLAKPKQNWQVKRAAYATVTQNSQTEPARSQLLLVNRRGAAQVAPLRRPSTTSIDLAQLVRPNKRMSELLTQDN